MRTFKFRAWDKGYRKLYQPEDIRAIPNDVDPEIEYLLEMEDEPRNRLCRPMSDVVLQQFTGTYDKDGKEVFEGDLIEMDMSNDCVFFFKVIFDTYGAFALAELGEGKDRGLNHTGFCFSGVPRWGRVVGHVFEKEKVFELAIRNDYREGSARTQHAAKILGLKRWRSDVNEDAVVEFLKKGGI